MNPDQVEIARGFIAFPSPPRVHKHGYAWNESPEKEYLLVGIRTVERGSVPMAYGNALLVDPVTGEFSEESMINVRYVV